MGCEARSYSSFGALVLGSIGLGCAVPDGEPRRQLLIVVDTNAPVVSQLDDDALSGDAAVDSLKIDVFDAKTQLPIDGEDLVVPDEYDWPVSFGVIGADEVLVRVRAFRAIFARRFGSDVSVPPEPLTEATIDRLIRLRLPDDGIRRARIVLDSECRGVRSSYAEPLSTCVDVTRMSVSPDEGIEWVDDVSSSSSVGTWVGARAVPCESSAVPGRKCIPGGFSLLGDLDLLSFDEFGTLDPLPLRPVVLPPFWLDELEVTIGDVRPLAAKLPGLGAQPSIGVEFCTWISATNSTNDAYPLNCIDWETATTACKERGGSLPSEAEWEHAARGRGERRLHVWGGAPPTCCIASLGRETGLSAETVCPGLGPEKAGAHPASEACGGLGDVSRDGVLDMAGSMTELCRDHLEPYDAPCWTSQAGVLRDPVCESSAKDHTVRGLSWEHGIALDHPARRGPDSISPSVGFRCAYEDAP